MGIAEHQQQSPFGIGIDAKLLPVDYEIHTFMIVYLAAGGADVSLPDRASAKETWLASSVRPSA